MKIIYPLCAAVLFLVAACVTVKRDEPETVRTTTTSVNPPLAPSASVTTHTTTY